MRIVRERVAVPLGAEEDLRERETRRLRVGALMPLQVGLELAVERWTIGLVGATRCLREEPDLGDEGVPHDDVVLLETEREPAFQGLAVVARLVAVEKPHFLDDAPFDGAIVAVEVEEQRLVVQHVLLRRACDERIDLRGCRDRVHGALVVVANLGDARGRDDDGRPDGTAAHACAEREEQRSEHEKMHRRSAHPGPDAE